MLGFCHSARLPNQWIPRSRMRWFHAYADKSKLNNATWIVNEFDNLIADYCWLLECRIQSNLSQSTVPVFLVAFNVECFSLDSWIVCFLCAFLFVHKFISFVLSLMFFLIAKMFAFLHHSGCCCTTLDPFCPQSQRSVPSSSVRGTVALKREVQLVPTQVWAGSRRGMCL